VYSPSARGFEIYVQHYLCMQGKCTVASTTDQQAEKFKWSLGWIGLPVLPPADDSQTYMDGALANKWMHQTHTTNRDTASAAAAAAGGKPSPWGLQLPVGEGPYWSGGSDKATGKRETRSSAWMSDSSERLQHSRGVHADVALHLPQAPGTINRLCC
jgi:hypothetical protein